MNRLLAFFRYQFRYRLSSIYIILGMVVGFVSLYNGIGIYQYIIKYTNDLRGNSYEYSAEMQLSHTEPFYIQNYISGVESIVRIDSVDVYVDAQELECKLTLLLGHKDEEPNYHMVEGRLPNEDEIVGKEQVVAVGRGRTEAIYYRNDIGYILLAGEEYRVTGIIGNEASDAQDYLIITYYDCLGKELTNNLDLYGYELIIESDLIDVEDECKIIESLATADGISVQYSESVRTLSGMTREEKDTMGMYMLLFSFAIVNCVIIGKYWIYERNRDIAILRILGLNKEQILIRLIKDMLFHITCSVIISALMQNLIYFLVTNKINYEISIYSVLVIGCVVILLSFVTIIGPALKVMKNPPIYEINGRCSE